MASLGLSPLPVQEERLTTFVQWLRNRQEVSVNSAPQYLSAVYSVARWFGSPVQGTCSDVIQGLMHVWKVADVNLVAKIQALPWPPLLLFQLQASLVGASVFDLDVLKLRVIVILWFYFILFSRADSAFGVYRSEVLVENHTVIFIESRFKRSRVDKLQPRTRRAYCDQCQSFVEALQHFLLLRDSKWATEIKPSLLLWQLLGEREPSSAILRQFIRAAERFWPVLVPKGLYSGHSMKRGAASAVLAVGVPIERICWWGGWSFSSSSVYEYLDFSLPMTKEAALFFGWMCRSAVGDQLAQLPLGSST